MELTCEAMILDEANSPLRLQRTAVSAPGAGEVLLRLLGSSLNQRDYSNVLNRIPGLGFPRIPGSDSCGEVIELGEGVSRFRVGDRVCATFFPRWLDGEPCSAVNDDAYGGNLNGFLRTHAVVPAEALVAAPVGLTAVESASLVCAGVTAWRAVVADGNLCTHETAVILGTGGVSLFALQFAKAIGARVILTSSSDEKLRRAAELGADCLINYRKTPNWHEEVLRLTSGGADLIIDVGGASTLEQGLRAVRMGGRISLVGFLARTMPLLDTPLLMAKQITVRGLSVGSRRHFEDLVKFVELHRIRPVIDSSFPLPHASAAFERLGSGLHFGKIGITLDGPNPGSGT